MRFGLFGAAALALVAFSSTATGASAADVFTVSGAVADFQANSYPGYTDYYLPLSGVSPTTVSPGDQVTVDISLDQAYTIPASPNYTNLLVLLTGSGFDGSPTAELGVMTFSDAGAPVGTYSFDSSSSDQLSSYAVLFPPNNQPITFDSLSDSFTVTTLDTPVDITSAAFDYQLVSTAPEPSVWALMMIGFGGLGLMLRRARMNAVARLETTFAA
jgi:hypothetical protein